MTSVLIPTMTMYNKYLKPLYDLGYRTLRDALLDDVINEREYRFILSATGRVTIPDENTFQDRIRERFREISMI